jgi:lysosomal acid lipase/cholesteryl ester hydrolase
MIRWCGKGGFADRKCTLDDTLDRWFDNRFPPLSIYHGGRDYLVLAEPLIERMKTKEKDVNVIKVTKLDLSEVCPFLLLLLLLLLLLASPFILSSILQP